MEIKTIAWNSYSLLPKKSELTQFIDKNSIKLLCISETWLSAESNISIPHFNCYRVDRKRGGVCIFIHKTIPHLFHKQISLDYAEAVSIKVLDSLGDITITALYCSPAASRMQSKEFFSRVLSIPGSSIIAGDFNCKHVEWNNRKSCYKGIDLCNFVQMRNFEILAPDGPTLIPTTGEPSAVDLVLTKAVLGVSKPKVINALSSDHFPILFNIPLRQTELLDIRVPNYAKANWEKFKSFLSEDSKKIEADFPSLKTETDIDHCIDVTEQKVHIALKASVPMKLPHKFRYPYSQDIQMLTKARNHFRKQFVTTGIPAHRAAKNQLNKLIKIKTAELNRQSFEKKISNLETRDNSIYLLAKCLKMRTSNLPPLLNSNGERSYSSQDKAESFAKAFLESHKTSENMKSKHEAAVKVSTSKIDRTKIVLNPEEHVLESEVREIVKFLNSRKAPGPDNISNRIIRRFPDNIIKILTRIFNDCLRLSYFPSKWKLGKITAIPKPGKDPTDPKNFRPITLLSNMGKIFEKIILSRLKTFEESTSLFIPNQFGFRDSHSTIHQVVRLTENISKNFNMNKSTGMVLLDIEKCFDSIWFDALIHKMLQFNFPPMLIKIVKSYVTNRKSFVSFQQANSETFTVPAGVPQGSILAPFLFNVFVSDIKSPKKSELSMFADDTAVSCSASWKNIKTIKRTLENALVKLNSYFNSWKIRINESKTEFIIFTKSTVMLKKLPAYLPIVNNHIFNWSPNVKYLGVTLDSKLTFRPHIDLSTKKAQKTMSVLFCLLKKNSALQKRHKVHVYKTYVRPILTYAGIVHMNCAKAHLKRLQILQNKCLRMALNASYFTKTTDLHKEAGIPTIDEFISKNSEKFYTKARDNKNELIKSLGTYADHPLPFRVKHKLPRAV